MSTQGFEIKLKFVLTHQPRIADDIGGQDRRQPPLRPVSTSGLHLILFRPEVAGWFSVLP